MSNAQDSAVAFILSQYATVDQAAIVAALGTKGAKVKAPSTPRVKRGKVKASEGAIVPVVLGAKGGMIDAAQFIAALHDAGKVTREGREPCALCHNGSAPNGIDYPQRADMPCVDCDGTGSVPNGKTARVPSGDPIKVRDDQATAIAAFIGYDRSVPHGIQVANATRQAQYALRPTVGKDRKHADPTLAGFIAGMPDDVRRMVLDLSARETLAAESMAQHDRSAADATDPAVRALHEGLSLLESERIASIRADLAKLIG